MWVVLLVPFDESVDLFIGEVIEADYLRLMSSAWTKGHWRSVLPIGSLRSAAILSRISQMWTGWLISFCV